MRSLQVAFHAFGAEHAAIERKLLPRLKADDFVVLDFELNAALLAAKATVRFDEAIRRDAAIQSLSAGKRQVRAKGVDHRQGIRWLLSHCFYLSNRATRVRTHS